MLTAEKVRIEIAEIILHNKHRSGDDPDYKRAERRLKLLQPLLAYLETEPSEEYVRKKLERCRALLQKIEDGYEAWCSNNQTDFLSTQNPKSKYDTMMDTATIRRHIKNAETILNG